MRSVSAAGAQEPRHAVVARTRAKPVVVADPQYVMSARGYGVLLSIRASPVLSPSASLLQPQLCQHNRASVRRCRWLEHCSRRGTRNQLPCSDLRLHDSRFLACRTPSSSRADSLPPFQAHPTRPSLAIRSRRILTRWNDRKHGWRGRR